MDQRPLSGRFFIYISRLKTLHQWFLTRRRRFAPMGNARLLYFTFMLACITVKTNAQCQSQYHWAKWDNFLGTSAVGTIVIDGDTSRVTMSTNYPFGETNQIYGYNSFDNFKASIPDSVTPETWWPNAKQGVTTMCFDKTVKNPVLMVATLGDPDIVVKLKFSIPYQLLYIDSNILDHTDTTLTGQEGYAVLLFPGDFNCVTIYSDTTEYWTNLSWGLNPLLFQVNITGNPSNCDSVTLTASGGNTYIWSGGSNRESATNTFYDSGTYSVTATNTEGCTVTATQTVDVNRPSSFINASICQGQSYLGHTTTGIFVDTLTSVSGCDSIRTINLSVITSPQPDLGKYQKLCTGDTLIIFPGKFDSYVWQDGSTQDSFAVSGPGTYSVTATNICGTKKTETSIVEQPCIIAFPNAFTPNNDGKNDLFRILNGYNLAGYHLIIFNRWGQEVFETSDYSNGWDGRFQGQQQVQGSYVWFCEYNKNGVHTELKGTVTLLR
jgi:gliding motility-associated-like protein